MVGMIGLDFETYSDVDLNVHGLARYIASPNFQPLIARVVETDYMGGGFTRERFDFVMQDQAQQVARLREAISNLTIVAHNAPFEKAVLEWMGLVYPANRFIDSAVVARAAGAAGKLEAAAPQLLDVAKLEQGRNLIKLFSVPGPYQEKNGNGAFDKQVVLDNLHEWGLFDQYCDVDAELGLTIVERYLSWLSPWEWEYQQITMEMNEKGWPVDVARVEEMQRRYIENQEVALANFRANCNAPDLNLNSLKQMKEWCEARGVKARSFNEANVERLLKRVSDKIDTMPLGDPKRDGYVDVAALLSTKQILGGSSLKKLQVILNTVTEDGRLVDQYLHCGAGQTLRTTGRSVQMQNLKRLHDIADVEELDDDTVEWDNDKLAENMRQLFTASDPQGALIVGDFSSVEARMLAWQANEAYALNAFRDGNDLYKVLAAKIYGVAHDDVTKEQRQVGKVGVLACGYQAGAGAVKDFAAGMGVEFSEGEASKLVNDWRAANSKIVAYWEQLDDMLRLCVEHGTAQRLVMGAGFSLTLEPVVTPASLINLHPAAQSIQVKVQDATGGLVMLRYFHGMYFRGREVCYYRPTERKTGDVWKNHYIHPKTKQLTFYKLYGGKLAGIITQSLCREIFFRVLKQVHQWCNTTYGQVTLIGQFHDEIVLDWKPGPLTLERCKMILDTFMSYAPGFTGFPLAAEVKHDYRYTK